MYDENLLQEAMAGGGFTAKSLGRKAGVDEKTAASVVRTGTGQPEKVYLVSKALGFKVKRLARGEVVEYDLRAVVKHRTEGKRAS